MIALPTFRGVLGGFNPLSLAPALWLSDTGSNAAQWNDISGNGRHATQATGSRQPSIVTGVINGRQVRRFDGTDDFLATPDFYLSTITVFAVYKPAAISTQQHVLRKGNSVGSQLEYGMRATNETTAVFIASTATTAVVPTQTKASGGNWIIQSGSFDGSNAATSVNGSVGSNVALSGSIANYTSGVRIGAAYASGIGIDTDPPGLALNGDAAEILIFSLLTDANRQRVESYLNAKYAIY
jgi:hypothetical protein